MSFQIVCPCGSRFTVKDEWVGRKAHCPKCGQHLLISRPQGHSPSGLPGQPAAARGPVADDSALVVTCPGCGGKLKVPAAMRGKAGVCPKCKTRLIMPAAVSSGERSSGDTIPRQPIPGTEASRRRCHRCQTSVVARNGLCPICYAFMWR